MPRIARRTVSMLLLLLLLLCIVTLASVTWTFPVTAVKGYFSSSYVQRETALTSAVTGNYQDCVQAMELSPDKVGNWTVYRQWNCPKTKSVTGLCTDNGTVPRQSR